jgi:hypothetical protein
MKRKLILGTLMMVAPVLLLVARATPGRGGTEQIVEGFKVLQPIAHDNLTIFPVIAVKTHDTADFLTLDEGIRSGDVVVTEVGNMHGMVRRPSPGYRPPAGAQVNTLVLVNNSKHPLILLAGEIVTGGKQDRIVGKDRIIPPESDPVDLSVFCVEHGRWVETSPKFNTLGAVMAQPSVRKKAMADQDQHQVWAAVQDQNSKIAQNYATTMGAAPPVSSGSHASSTAGAPGIVAQSHSGSQSASETVEVGGAPYTVAPSAVATLRTLDSTTSYAKVRENPAIDAQIKSITEPVEKSFASVIKQLRAQNAVGVVVAVKGKIIWADLFASQELLSKYWPKLLQSYAAEAFSASGGQGDIDVKTAQAFVDNWSATHEVTDTEPGLYRQTEFTGNSFKAFELTSLLPKQVFDLHLSKMAD